MNEPSRKKSPRAPSIPLEEAIERALKVYEKEKRHPAPVEVVAQDLGYRNASSGAALSMLASLRYYGLLERPQEGKLAVAKEVETFKFAPSDEMKNDLLVKWLTNPPIFAELLEKFREQGLPSDAVLRFELIQRGFSPVTAASVIGVFQKSVQFSRYFERSASNKASIEDGSVDDDAGRNSLLPNQPESRALSQPNKPLATEIIGAEHDRIPVRLSANRRAYLLIPSPFYAADKDRLKAQIDLLLTDDDNTD